MISINANVPGDLNLNYPASSSLQDTQEFERKKTMSGYVEKPKNRFSENKKWVITWEYLTQAQLRGLSTYASKAQFTMRDPLGRPCVVKPIDFRPYHMNAATGESGELLSGATLELLVVNANHSLYLPRGTPLTTPANSPSMMPTLSGTLYKTPLRGGNRAAFGPVLEYELSNPPLEWNRSARAIQSIESSSAPPALVSSALAESMGSVFLAFETQTQE